MKISKITNLDTISLIENSAELFRLRRYRSKEYVEAFIGLGIHRSGFYGLYDANLSSVESIDRIKTEFNSAQDINLLIEGIVVLDKIPVNVGPGDLFFRGYGVLEVNGVVVYDGRSGVAVATWGSISGTLSDQTDLQNALNNKKDDFAENTAFNKNFGMIAGTVCQGNDPRLSDSRTPTPHTHVEADITDLDKYTKAEVDGFFEGENAGRKEVDWTNVVNKPANFPPDAHTHVIADITDAGALASEDNVDTHFIVNNAVTNTKMANMPQNTFKGRDNVGTGNPKDLTIAEVKTMLNYLSISDIDTLAELNTIITDANLDDVSNPRTPTVHAATHISGGSDPIAGENLSVNIVPPLNNYIPTTNTLKGHLNGIDNKLGTLSITTAGLLTRIYFTGDTVVLPSGTYFRTSQVNKGTVLSASPTPLSVPSNTALVFNRDIISIAFPVPTVAYAGHYNGNLSVRISADNAQQRYKIEAYRADTNGNPLPSGITGAPVGTLGVTVLTIMDSGLINLVPNDIISLNFSGNLTEQITLLVGERVRYRVIAEKVGSSGGNITMEVFYGSNHNSYYDIPTTSTTDTVVNVSSVLGASTSDALENLDLNKANLSALGSLAFLNTVGTLQINDNAVTTPKLAANSVDTSKIIDSNVTNAKLAANSVITAKILDNNVTNEKLRDSAGLSVIGKFDAISGDPADIVAATDGHILRRSGATIGFGTIDTAGITDNNITNAKLRDSAALSVIGRSANTVGDPADIAAATDGHVLRRSGTTLGFGTVATAGITNDAVDNTKLANMAQATVKGRAVGAVTGDPTDLTSAQVTAIADVFTTSLKGLAPASGGGTTNFLRADGTWAAPAGGGGGLINATIQSHIISNITSTYISNNVVNAIRMLVPFNMTVSQLGTIVSSGGTGTMSLGVYDDAFNLLGQVSIPNPTTGVQQAAVTPFNIVGGTYIWLAVKDSVAGIPLFKSTVFGNATICRSQFFGSPGLPASIASGTADTVAPYMYIKA